MAVERIAAFDIWGFYHRLVMQVARGEYRLRTSDHALLDGPYRAIGDCLAPIVEDGDLLWLDKHSFAQHGDIVQVRFNERSMRNMLDGVKAGAAAGNPIDIRWLEDYGEDLDPLAVKLLVVHDGARFAAVRPDAADDVTPVLLPLTERYFDGGILGRVVRVERAGKPLYVDRVSASRPRFIDGRPIDDTAFPGGSLLPDPWFDRSTSLWDGTGPVPFNGFWRTSALSGTAAAAIESTGGVQGGLLRITGDFTGGPGNVTVSSVPRRGSQYVTGERVRLNLRIRKTNNPTLTAGDFIVHAGGGDADGILAVSGTGLSIEVPFAAINAWTVDEWQEFETEFRMVNVPKSQPQKPYAVVSLGAAFLSHDVTFEIDTCNLTRIATPEPEPDPGYAVMLSGENVADADTSPGSAVAGIRVNSDGTVDRNQGGSYTQIDAATDWIVPNGSASGDFDVRATLIAGSLSGTGEDPGVWLDLGSDREFQVVRVTVGISACSFRLDIRDDTGSTVASATYSASAEIV